MKILAITNLFPNTKEPVRGIFNKQQFLKLTKLCELEVVAPIPWHYFSPVQSEENISGIKVYHPRYFMIPKIGRLLYGFLFFLSLLWHVKKIYANFKFDLIFATWAYPDAFGSFLIAKVLNKPIVIKVHGSDINIHTRYYLRKKMISYALRQSNKVISVSNSLKNRMIEIGVPEDKIAVISNGIDTGVFKSMDKNICRRETGLPIGKKIILFVGNLVPVKGVAYLIDSFRCLLNKIPDSMLVIIGEGPLKNNLVKKARSLNLDDSIKFIGKQPHSAIPVWMNACDVFCLPSLNEGCPNVILEALACGKPVVATVVGGIPEIIINSGNGILVESKNINNLAKGLQHALEILSNNVTAPIQTTAILDWKENAKKLCAELQMVVEKETIIKDNILYHHRTRGQGVEDVHIRGIANALAELGNGVIIVSPPGVDSLVEQKPLAQHKSKAALIWKSVSKYTPQILFELLEVAYNLVSYVKIRRVIKKEPIKALYERYAFFGLSGILLAKRYKIPFVLEVNEISGIERQRGQVLTGFAKWIERKVFKYADAIVAVSSFLKNEIIKMGIEPGKVYILPNAIDIKDLNIKSDIKGIKDKLDLRGKFVLTFVGSFCRWDKLDFLIETFGELCRANNNLQLVLIGDGKERKSLERLIAGNDLEDKILLTGKIERKKVLEYVSVADICVIPHTNPFGSPVVLFEYMGLGRPVIAPRLGPIEDIIIDNRNGLIFEPLNKESFKNKILALINDPKKRESIGIEARNTVLNSHLWIKNGVKIVNIIDSLNLKTGNKQEKVKVPILIYHNIGEGESSSIYTIPAKSFKEHVEWLYQGGYTPITLSELASWKFNGGRLPKKPIVMTFDDGHRNCYEIAFPILKAHGFQASFFVTTNWLGKGDYMDWEQVKAMKDGGMEIGSHGHTHTPLSSLGRHAVRYELENSKLLIEGYLRDKVDFVSIPGGYFNSSIKQIAKDVGYKGVLTSKFGTNDKTSDLYALKRVGVRGYYTPQYLDRLMNDKINLNYRVDYFLRSVLKKSLGDRGYKWLLKHCFGSV